MDWFIIGLINVILFKHRCMSNSPINIKIPNQIEYIEFQSVNSPPDNTETYKILLFTFVDKPQYCLQRINEKFVLRSRISNENCVIYEFKRTVDNECVQVRVDFIRIDNNTYYVTKADLNYYLSNNKDQCLKLETKEAEENKEDPTVTSTNTLATAHNSFVTRSIEEYATVTSTILSTTVPTTLLTTSFEEYASVTSTIPSTTVPTTLLTTSFEEYASVTSTIPSTTVPTTLLTTSFEEYAPLTSTISSTTVPTTLLTTSFEEYASVTSTISSTTVPTTLLTTSFEEYASVTSTIPSTTVPTTLLTTSFEEYASVTSTISSTTVPNTHLTKYFKEYDPLTSTISSTTVLNTLVKASIEERPALTSTIALTKVHITLVTNSLIKSLHLNGTVASPPAKIKSTVATTIAALKENPLFTNTITLSTTHQLLPSSLLNFNHTASISSISITKLNFFTETTIFTKYASQQVFENTEVEITNISTTPAVSKIPTTTQVSEIPDDFGPWSPWSDCSETCEGYQRRDRKCLRPCKSNYTVDVMPCGETNCPIHGGFTEWTGWSECSSQCGGGRKQRNRTCDNPEPQYEGNQCVGKSEEESECNPQLCPQNASPGQWTDWSGCSKPCNNGSYVRTRECKKGLYGGLEYCEEPLVEEEPCNYHTCPNTFASTKLRFNLKYLPEYSKKESNPWNDFQEDLKKQIMKSFEDKFPNNILDVELIELRNGSVIANFTILFKYIDSFQLVTFQESIETEGSISKYEVIEIISSYSIFPQMPNAPPSNITAVTLSGTSLHVSWSDVPFEHQNGNITGYILFYREKLDLSSSYSVLASDGYELTLTGLRPATLYSLRLLACTSRGNGIASPEMLRSTFEMLPSTEPKQVNASTLGAFGMYLEWKRVSLSDMNGIPLGHKITISGNNKFFSINVSYTETATVLENLTPDTNYVFEVCAFNKVGEGPCQRAVNRTLPSAPTAPPQNVTVSDIMTHNSLTLIWSSPPEERIHGDLTAYNITYQAIQNGETLYLERKLFYYTTHPSVTTIIIKGLNGNTKYLFSIAAVNIHGVGVATSVYGKTCNCPEVVSSAFYTVKPYVFYRDQDYDTLHGVYPRLIKNMITVGCGICHRPSGSLYTTLDNQRDGRNASALKSNLQIVLNEIDDYTDLVFPVVSHASTRIYMGYPFVNVINHPGVVFITKEESVNEIVVEMIKRVMGVVPVLGLNVLMLVIAGFIIWILERMWNVVKQSDFSAKLWKGVGEGIYWAFITQGTHGYGDYSPVTVASRIFTVLWILISLILSSIIVGFIVSVFTTINGSPGVTIYGSKIGAINGSLEQNFGVLRNGKMRFEAEYLSVSHLAEDLLDNKIQGILLDAYTAGASKEALNHPQLRPTAVYEYSKAYGLVLSGDLRYIGDEIRDYIKVNEKYILEIIQNNTERMEPREKMRFKSVFDPRSTVLATALSWLFGIYILLFCIGVSFHCIRLAKKKAKVARVPTLSEKWYENIKIVGNSLFDFVTSKKAQIVALEKKHYLQCKLLYKDRGQSSLDAPEPIRRRRRKPKPKNSVTFHNGGDHPYNILNQSLSVEESIINSIEFPRSIDVSCSTVASRVIEVPLLHSTPSRRKSTNNSIAETTFQGF